MNREQTIFRSVKATPKFIYQTNAKTIFGYKAYIITTNSMEPTINVGDIIIVSGIEKSKIELMLN